MKTAALLPTVFFAVALCAQQPSGANSTSLVQLGPNGKPVSPQQAAQSAHITSAMPSRCPINMHARQGGHGATLRVQDGSNPSVPVMEPSLTLLNPPGKRIVSAAVTAHGFGINNRPTPLETSRRRCSYRRPEERQQCGQNR